jgi:bifunctional non-homologous end joining protein LigD
MQDIIIKISGQNLKVTHLDKIFFPKEKITKGEVIEYYRKIAPFILPYLKDRPESLNRHPNGILGKNFFQKDFAYQPPNFVKTKKIFSESNDDYINFLVCENILTLIYLANLGCIEMNPWFSTIKHLEKPDYAVIDLDPEDISFEKVVEIALEVHNLLGKLKVPNFCKTSGATGMHIYIPLGAKYTYDQAKEFSHLVAVLVNRKIPNITSVERNPKKRQKKVYLDYLQNRKGQTLAAPYSLRPKPGAPVATPLEWKEVKKGLSPSQFTIKTIFPRLKKKGDIFKGIFGKGIDLKKVLNLIEKL